MKNNHKGFALIEGLLIILIIGALAGVGWYVYKNQDSSSTTDDVTFGANSSRADETEEVASANTKTCENLFSFDLPEDWYFITYDAPQVTGCYLSNKPKEDQPPQGVLYGDDITVAVSVSDVDENKTLSEIVDDGINSSAETDYPTTLAEKTDVTLNSGETAILVRLLGGHLTNEQEGAYNLRYKNNSKLLTFYWRADSVLSDKALEVAKTIKAIKN